MPTGAIAPGESPHEEAQPFCFSERRENSDGQIALLDFFVLFQLSYTSVVFDMTVIHDVSPVRMFQSELDVLFGE